MRKLQLFAAMVLWSVSAQSAAPTAVEELAQLRKQAHEARAAGDHRGYLEAAIKVRSLLNDSPRAIESTALGYAELDDKDQALAALAEFAEMGQVDDSLLAGKDTMFASLHDRPEYRSILEHFRRNETAVQRSESAFTLADPGLIPEDIDFDQQSKAFLITSVLEKEIVRVTSSGKITPFASSPSGWPMLAIKVDAKRNRVWATEVGLDGFTAVAKADWGKSAVLCLDLGTGKLLSRIEAPHTALGDLALTPTGDAIVSDGEGGGVYRVAEGKLVLINRSDFISPQTPVVLPGGKLAAVPDYVRGIGIVDLRSGSVSWLNHEGGAKVALSGVDGLYYANGAFILTQNGTSPERVVRMKLDQSQTKVVSEEVIERSTATLGDPTHGVVVGDRFYYIANSGWDVFDEHGDMKQGVKLSPGRVMRFRIR